MRRPLLLVEEGPGEETRKMEEKRGNKSRMIRTLKPLQTATMVLILPFLCMGCFYAHNSVNGGGNNLTLEKNIGAEHAPVLVPGSEFIYRKTNYSDDSHSEISMNIKEKKESEGKQAYWIEVVKEGGSYFNIYDMNLNWIGLFGEGRTLEKAEPCIRIFEWPLKIGEKWKSEYTLRDYSDHSHSVYVHSSKVDVNIRTYEQVTVPAGTFKALRIQVGGETVWYAPSIEWIVKEQMGPYGKDGWLLELAGYNIPQRATGLSMDY
jgi:hypothetical protein